MSFRAFISVDIGAQPSLIDLENILRNTGVNLKLVEPANIHLTLRFLGELDEQLITPITSVMTDCVKTIKPFKILLNGVGAFPSIKYMKVIWVGVQNAEELINIANNLNSKLDKLGISRADHSFSPHVTVARVKGVSGGKERLISVLSRYREHNFGSIDVDCIRLKRSVLTPKGPEYSTVKEVKLGMGADTR
jgi:2'-5' RNA ligase